MPIELQWGRNLFVAECGWRAVPSRAITCASMGPQLVRCGMRLPDQGTKRRLRCFNGAATCSLRNDGGPIYGHDGIPQLQWGRNLFVAECPHGKGDATVPVFQASMGPQLVRCGMLGNVDNKQDGHAQLQWGRNLFVAECGHVSITGHGES